MYCVDGDAVCPEYGHVFFLMGIHLNHAKKLKAYYE